MYWSLKAVRRRDALAYKITVSMVPSKIPLGTYDDTKALKSNPLSRADMEQLSTKQRLLSHMKSHDKVLVKPIVDANYKAKAKEFREAFDVCHATRNGSSSS